MPDDPRDIVESGYDTIADRYAEVIRTGRGPETYFRSFLARVLELIPEGGTVLDLGCGAGRVRCGGGVLDADPRPARGARAPVRAHPWLVEAGRPSRRDARERRQPCGP